MIDLGELDLGQLRQIRCQFQAQDTQGAWANADPTTVQFVLEVHGQPKVTYTYGTDDLVEKLATGSYQVAWLCVAQGRHDADWIADGAVIDRQSCTFYVRANPLYTPPA